MAVENVRQLDFLGDLDRAEAVVGQPQGLIVDERVRIPALAQQVDGALGAPYRPVVHAVQHLRLRAPPLDCLPEVLSPCVRIADLRSAQRVGVVQRVAAVLGSRERAQLLDEPVHL